MVRFALLIAVAQVALAADFVRDVAPVLERGGCVGCHSANGVASGTRLKLPEEHGLTEAFGRSLQVLVNRQSPEKSLLLAKPTLRVAHAGGKRIEPGSTDEKVLREWVTYLATAPVMETKPETLVAGEPKRALRRLTHAQYNNTMRDLLGDSSRLADSFPPEDFIHGFRNQYPGQNASPMLSEAYSNAAEKLARQAFRTGDSRNLIPCKTTDLLCRDRFLKEFGRRAFRRPLTAAELLRYQNLFSSQKQFYAGAQIALEAMLQSPAFLLRVEHGADASQQGYEVASKLAYGLWNSTPDEALLNAAAKGQLATVAGVEKEARRLLASEKAQDAVREFLTDWLRLDRLNGTIRERRQYPQFTPELTVAMAEESRRLAEALIWQRGNFMELFSATYSYLNSDLAKLYGLTAPSAEYTRVDLPASTERAGILGHASILTATSKPAETSPTARGLFVREHFLCQEVPQPPPGVSTNLPPLSKEKPVTTRERLGIHLSSPSCASCHTLIDPIGFGLEKFDAIGARREKLHMTVPAERKSQDKDASFDLPLDTSGWVAGLVSTNGTSAPFSSPRELGRILAESAQCQECVVKQAFRYLMGRHETSADAAALARATQEFRASGFQFTELLVSLMKWTTYPPPPGQKEMSRN
ncbi:MAG: DUF1592 domain-containing protein [Bryobacteraceae bacterium]|nr:DUF1592 domain-containing protein [Bryobacteraceae bacterium]